MSISFYQIEHKIAIASGKGGVGKSTTTINLAIALQKSGARVGVLDADIYGPSQGLLTGLSPTLRPKTAESRYFIPIEVHGIKLMSMSQLTTEKTPLVWRGPMVSGAVKQLMTQTQWGVLDYLLIDLPPGTGDIHLTVSKLFSLSGAIMVTTPQDIALLDCKKGIEMFRKVDVPIIGIIENMSYYQCPCCDHIDSIFGKEGGERLAKAYETALLGRLPLLSSIRLHSDKGQPITIAKPDSFASVQYQKSAQALLKALKSYPSKQIPIQPLDE